MKKKLFAAAVAACLSVSSAMVASAAMESTDALSGDLTVEAFYSERTNALKIDNNESYTIKFHNKSNGSNNWDNFLLGVAGDLNTGADYEIANFRADAWGWGGGMSDFVDPNTDGNKMVFENNANWDTWVADMQAGVDVEIKFSKADNTISYEAAIGSYSVKFTGTSGKALPDTVYVYLTGENVELTNISSSKEGDVSEGDLPAPTPAATVKQAEGNAISGDLNVTSFFGNKTDAVNIKSGETYTFEFNDKSNGSNNWDNYVMAVTTAIGDAYTGADQEVLVVRADSWGWGGGASDIVAPDAEGNALVFENNVGEDGWDAFKALLQGGSPVKVVLSREGDKLTYEATVGTYTIKTTATSGKALPADLYVFFTGENCDLTGFKTTSGVPGAGGRDASSSSAAASNNSSSKASNNSSSKASTSSGAAAASTSSAADASSPTTGANNVGAYAVAVVSAAAAIAVASKKRK